VIQEYSLLRSTILDVLGPVEPADFRIILDILDAAVAEATTHYVELQAGALRESEERFRLLVGAVKDYAIYMLDPDGRIVIWNEGAERITGYAATEIVGQHVSVFYSEADRAEGVPMQHLHTAVAHDRVEVEGPRVTEGFSYSARQEVAGRQLTGLEWVSSSSRTP
jgi:PAS domain-containing protein